jgi:hypothetical protein
VTIGYSVIYNIELWRNIAYGDLVLILSINVNMCVCVCVCVCVMACNILQISNSFGQFPNDFGPLKLMASHPCISFLSTLDQILALFKQEIKLILHVFLVWLLWLKCKFASWSSIRILIALLNLVTTYYCAPGLQMTLYVTYSKFLLVIDIQYKPMVQ